MRPFSLPGTSRTRSVAICALCLILISTIVITGCDDEVGNGSENDASIVFHGADGDVTLDVEVANTQSDRELGLMNRTEMPEDHGMIFVWSYPARSGFWMKDTLIPLSIAFIDEGGVIIDIQDMEPQTFESHSPGKPYYYAVEVNQGYYERHGIKVGDSVDLSQIQAA